MKGEVLMKWFFCWCQDSDFRDDHNWKDLIRVSVESALKNTSLEPNFIYDGEPSDFTDELARKGVKIIYHRLSFTKGIVAHSPNDKSYQAIARGAFLRFDIPKFVTKEDGYVLYTDADVMFLKDEKFEGYRPNLIAAAPQFAQGNRDDFNSGVMLINTREFSRIYDQLITFTLKHLHLGLDQEVLRVFLGHDYLLLPDALNWKPYWGIKRDAAIIHWHGPKPETVGHLLRGRSDTNQSWRSLFDRNPAAYEYYHSLQKEFLASYKGLSSERPILKENAFVEQSMSNWVPIEQLPPGTYERQMVVIKRLFVSAPIAVFWFNGAWIYPPHWDDFPGEKATHFKFSDS